jgi:hypothetical protein
MAAVIIATTETVMLKGSAISIAHCEISVISDGKEGARRAEVNGWS